MQVLNPILVLAASAARSGHATFAVELLGVSRGNRDAMHIRKRITRLAGMSNLCIAKCVETAILTTGNPSLKRGKM